MGYSLSVTVPFASLQWHQQGCTLFSLAKLCPIHPTHLRPDRDLGGSSGLEQPA